MAPRRIVSLAPSNTEILFALGLGDRVVGVDEDSDWPSDGLLGKKRVGRDLQIDVDEVAGLAPDLVVAAESVPGMEKVVAGVRAAGLAHIVLHPRTFEDVFTDILTVAEACGVPDTGRGLVARLRARLPRPPSLVPRTRVYWEWWPKPFYSPGRWSWMNGMLAAVGAENVFADVDAESFRPKERDVVAAAPDVIGLCWCGTLEKKMDPAAVARRPGWRDVPAVARGRVFAFPEALFGRPGPRLVDGVETLAAHLPRPSSPVPEVTT
ncbi:MAG: cobalamin-binding protein [Methanobacteriota archaeon]